MKIFIFKKKALIFIGFILFFIFIIYLSFYNQLLITTATASDVYINNNLEEKITALTKGTEKFAYLTFDDGPTIQSTPKVLDTLKSENVKASFFVIGKYVAKHPELVKRAYEEGHYIANHGYDHNNNNLYASDNSFISEVTNTDIEIGKAIGIYDYCSHIFRFPNGYMSPMNKSQKKRCVKLLRDMDYTYIDWNCLNNDSVKKYSSEQLLNNLKSSAKGKGTLVILMHDTTDVSNSSLVLKDSIIYLKEQGYEFKNFYDLF